MRTPTHAVLYAWPMRYPLSHACVFTCTANASPPACGFLQTQALLPLSSEVPSHWLLSLRNAIAGASQAPAVAWLSACPVTTQLRRRTPSVWRCCPCCTCIATRITTSICPVNTYSYVVLLLFSCLGPWFCCLPGIVSP
jgi:hypothetical protein